MPSAAIKPSKTESCFRCYHYQATARHHSRDLLSWWKIVSTSSLLPVQSLPLGCSNIQRPSSDDGVLPPWFIAQSEGSTKRKSSISPTQYAAQGKNTARFNTSGKLLPKDRLPSHFVTALTWCLTLPWRWEVAARERSQLHQVWKTSSPKRMCRQDIFITQPEVCSRDTSCSEIYAALLVSLAPSLSDDLNKQATNASHSSWFLDIYEPCE